MPLGSVFPVLMGTWSFTSHLQSQCNPAITLFDETPCRPSPLIICRVTSAQNSFDFKRYGPNLPLMPFYIRVVQLCLWLAAGGAAPSHLLTWFASGFLWDCHIRGKESLILTRTESLGGHRGRSEFCKSLYFPLQTPLPAGNRLFYKRRKGAVKR